MDHTRAERVAEGMRIIHRLLLSHTRPPRSVRALECVCVCVYVSVYMCVRGAAVRSDWRRRGRRFALLFEHEVWSTAVAVHTQSLTYIAVKCL